LYVGQKIVFTDNAFPISIDPILDLLTSYGQLGLLEEWIKGAQVLAPASSRDKMFIIENDQIQIAFKGRYTQSLATMYQNMGTTFYNNPQVGNFYGGGGVHPQCRTLANCVMKVALTHARNLVKNCP